jgi:hypothetical protein
MTADPGVPLKDYRHVRANVLLICNECQLQRTFDREEVIARLQARGAGGENTGIREVAQHVKEPCPRCKGVSFESRPAFAPSPEMGNIAMFPSGVAKDMPQG